MKFIGKVTCADCGTGYSQNGPLGHYQDKENESYGDTTILCDECAEKRDNQSGQEEK